MGRTVHIEPLERPALAAWVGASRELRDYVYALECRVTQLEEARVVTEQLQADELGRRDRILIEKDLALGRLEQELRLLREQARLSSRTSSKPPSSDPPSAPKRVPRKPSGRRRGGQSGHQVVELPVVRPHVTEHRLHSLNCGCGHTTRACLPEGAEATGFGPRLEATVATLVSACRLSHRTTQSVLADMFGVRVGLGTVPKIVARVSRAIEARVEQAREHVREADETKHADETGWFQRGSDGTNEDGRRAWLWVAATAAVVVFRVALSRSKAVAREMIGELTRGVLVSDRYSVYSWVGVHARQLCSRASGTRIRADG